MGRRKKAVLVVFIILILAIGFLGFRAYVSAKTKEKIANQCKDRENGILCEIGKWVDRWGRICGGMSCVGHSTGRCYSGVCVTHQQFGELNETEEKNQSIKSSSINETTNNEAGNLNVEKNLTLKKEYLEWLNKTKQWLNFENPFIECIYEKTCNGSFSIFMEVNYTLSPELINSTFKRYGNVTRILTYHSLKKHNLYLTVKELDIINEFIDFPFVSKIHIDQINTDYNPISDEELKSCTKDEDCIMETGGCIYGPTLINKNYSQYFNNKAIIANIGIACIETDWSFLAINVIRCLNSSCNWASYKSLPCEVQLYKECTEKVPQSLWESPFYNLYRYSTLNYIGPLTCRNITDLCGEYKRLEK